jgi:hypothetical protein
MTVTYALYGFVTAYSSQPIYTSGCIALINVLFSSYVIVGYAVLEQVSRLVFVCCPWNHAHAKH